MGDTEEETAPVVDAVTCIVYWVLASSFLTFVLRYAPKDTRWTTANWLIMVVAVMGTMLWTYRFVVYAQRLF